MAERFKLRRKRIGSSQQHQPANRVNKFLSQAIEARSVDQEKAAHVNMFSLCFRDPEKERQVRRKRFYHIFARGVMDLVEFLSQFITLMIV